MIKAIQYHLADTPEQQTQLENQSARALEARKQLNRSAFQTMMPNLAVVFTEDIVDDFGLFCNKQGQLNLASQSSGQVLYGLNPITEAQADIERFIISAPHIKLTGSPVRQVPLLRAFQMPESKGFVPALPLSPVPAQADTVVMLGLGLGHALEALLQSAITPKNIVIYEPTLDFFRGSVQVANWYFILSSAAERGIQLFLQIGQNAESIGQDLQELQTAFQAENVYVYRHYHHPVMDAVFEALVQPGFNAQAFASKATPLQAMDHVTQYLAPRSGIITSDITREQASEQSAAALALKERNLAAFAQQFPEVYQQFVNYQPMQWQAFFDNSGEINLYHEGRLGALYHCKPSELSAQTMQLFADEPNRNDMLAGYKGGKLWPYIHFTQARKFGALAEKLENDGHFVPDIISSLIWFGLGLGYQLGDMVNKYHMKSLYIYEPNPDFFYWSLFTVPWHDILPAQREAGMHWYLNIGDDGKHLQNDMFLQFQSSGGYLTASAFFYSPMYSPAMQPHIRQLKRDLESYLMLGEYFDHVRYSFRHIERNLTAGMHLLKADARLTEHFAHMPIVVVGNGPSLDSCIELLHQRRSEFLVVSCGTALKALYEAGITPDFHCDVEQNRATYSWITQVQDFAWLKRITLLSLTSIHPDTAALFKQQLGVFKFGEASTTAYLNRSGLTQQLMALNYCYPTVTNLALSLTLALGFKNIYLLGVDLGFKSHDHHHSKGSAYYQADTGKSWHDSRKSAGEGIPVKGNFTPVVLTKYEFQLSRRIMEQLLSEHEQVVVTNASDGAYIEGAVAQRFKDIPPQPTLDREDIKVWMAQQLYTRQGVEPLLSVVEKGFDNSLLQQEAEALLAISQEPVHSIEQALQRLEKEKQYMLKLYQNSSSLWFYLMFASSHFASAALVRFLYLAKDEQQALDYFEQGSAIWREYIQKAINSWLEEPEQIDQTLIKYLPHVEPSPPAAP